MKETGGTVVTFYSYKGGVGRSFALANVAVLLAMWGRRVLCIDWDLDAPGLQHYFRPHVGPIKSGLLELIEGLSSVNDDWRRHISRVKVAQADRSASIDLIAAGGKKGSYARRVQELSWADLYEHGELGLRLEELRDIWTHEYDVVLIDSRTGITDVGAICTAQLPDIVVIGFTANEQSLGGAIEVIDKARAARNRLPYDRAGLLTLPMPCRFDSREEYQQAAHWREEFARRLKPLYAPWLPAGIDVRRVLELTTVPYLSYWSFGEQLAVVAERTSNPDYVSYYFETIAALLTHHLDRAELLVESREQYVEAARRVANTRDFRYDVYISSGADLSKLADAVADALEARGVRVVSAPSTGLGANWPEQLDDYVRQTQFLVPLLGAESGKNRTQQADIRSFLAAATDPHSSRTIIPVVADPAALDGLPTLLRSFRSVDGTGTPQDIANQIVSAMASVTTVT